MHLFGILTLKEFVHGPVETFGQMTVVLGALAVFCYLLYTKRFLWLWREWLTSLDHKKIGVMYIVLALVMGLRGFIDAIMMRGEQATSVAGAGGYLSPDHFAQIFTAHGTIMIFFMAMPFMFGLINLVLPLQIGARDVAFPFLNSLSFWLTAAGAVLVNLSLVVGEFAATGWIPYPPLSELAYSPGVGVDYWIWALQIAGAGTLLSGINFLATVVKMRAPGMTLMRIPVFTWTAVSSMILVVFAFPILTVSLALLSLDRLLSTHFFTASALGGNPMMFVNLIWAWGHPEVYILILPAFGAFSEVVPVFSQKKLFGYTSMVIASLGIAFFSYLVWLHHFFTMGAGADVNAFFGIMTMIIAIPTGVKIFNWLFTMFRGRIIFRTPMLWFMGFVATFVWGGMTGVLMSVPPADFELHNSLFLVAHFHNMIIGGVLFGFFAGLSYWFPKVTGFSLDERLGTWAFWLWVLGFLTAFVPLYLLGLMGATRRVYTAVDPTYHALFVVAGVGALIIAAAIAVQIWQLIVSFRTRDSRRVALMPGGTPDDPWNARTLEWSVPSPAPEYNFAHIPQVHGLDAWWTEKQNRHERAPHAYEDIEVPKNTGMGPLIAGAMFVMGFAIIWHMWLIAVLSALAGIVLLFIRLFTEDIERVIPAAEVERIERQLRERTI